MAELQLLAVATEEVVSEAPVWLTVVLGIGIVFLGLISLVIICSIMGAILKERGDKAPEKKEIKSSQAPVAQANAEEIPNRQEFVAAVSAAIAEEMGTDVSAIRILSIKKM